MGTLLPSTIDALVDTHDGAGLEGGVPSSSPSIEVALGALVVPLALDTLDILATLYSLYTLYSIVAADWKRTGIAWRRQVSSYSIWATVLLFRASVIWVGALSILTSHAGVTPQHHEGYDIKSRSCPVYWFGVSCSNTVTELTLDEYFHRLYGVGKRSERQEDEDREMKTGR
ncbi:hypothetical protein EV426DRAFT_94968 [Tirmania nivea]|nr:hypothetical protein EV426DRAFT_94968 [Tirmania nivea]